MKTPYRRFRFFIPLVILIALLALSYVVLWLWNTVLVAVVPVKPVTLWQAAGLLLLSRILFGGFKFGPRGGHYSGGEGAPPWRSRWRQMSDEDRSKFKREWRKRCGDKPDTSN
ncbi:hypothetical protein [Spirosoma radiotolerans]|uniref:Uncharacterized protein n=1 Tax=Spirosoma radiotolerans TaxID=1379870 RepID=A0A0E3V7Y2_9BACT|nr:hypothetical protein [Spirosoma radiotolerans]AKD56272.1 hypothetical protein SD10_16560 [Spirosoma radiotolerans]